jgi:hypothetical protein
MGVIAASSSAFGFLRMDLSGSWWLSIRYLSDSSLIVFSISLRRSAGDLATRGAEDAGLNSKLACEVFTRGAFTSSCLVDLALSLS